MSVPIPERLTPRQRPGLSHFPRMEDSINFVGSATFVTKMETFKSYWQLLSTHGASETSAFVNPDNFLLYKAFQSDCDLIKAFAWNLAWCVFVLQLNLLGLWKIAAFESARLLSCGTQVLTAPNAETFEVAVDASLPCPGAALLQDKQGHKDARFCSFLCICLLKPITYSNLKLYAW